MCRIVPILVGARAFWRGLYLAFSRRKVTLVRTAFSAFTVGLYSLFYITVRIGHMLDDLFYRQYRAQEVRSPVFIISTPRSGTTFLHRLMCLDEEQFTYFKTYQTLLPSITLYRLLDLLSALDRRLARILPRLRAWIERKAFAGWRGIHPIGLDRAEEDEGIFLYTLHTPALYLLFPFVDELCQVQFTDNLPLEQRRRIMDYYRRCIQRHLYASGGDRTLLSKNVHSTGRILSLLETFPDARFILLLRNPYQAIPSLLSLFYAVWQVPSPDIPRQSPETQALAHMGYDYYRHLARVCKQIPEERFVCVGYEELVADPRSVVERIYQHFGLPMSEAFRVRLERATQQSRGYQSAHRYSLEEFGLDPKAIYRELKEIFETYGFAPSPAAGVAR